MQGRIDENAEFRLYLTAGSGEPEVTLSGAEVTRILAHHVMGAHLTLDIAQQIHALPTRDLYPRRRLLGQHKPLRGQAT